MRSTLRPIRESRNFWTALVEDAKERRLCDDNVWQTPPDAGTEILEFYAAFLWGTGGDECADPGNGGRYHQDCDDSRRPDAAGARPEIQTDPAGAR